MFVDNHIKSTEIAKRLVKNHVAPYKFQVMTAVFFMVIAALASAIIVRLTKPIIDRVLIEHDHNVLVIITSAIFLLYIIKGIAEFFQGYLIKFLGQQILTDLQMAMYKHLLRADYALIASQASGRIISRFTNDIILMRGAISNLLVGCAKHLLSIVFLVGIMFTLDFYLSLFVFLAFPVAIYPVQKLGRRMKKVSHDAQEELSNFTAKLDEAFGSIKVIKSFCTERHEFRHAQNITNKILGFYKKSAQLDSVTSPLMEVLSGFTIIGLIWYGNYAIAAGYMTTGTLFTFIMAFVSAYRPFKSLVSLNVNLQEGLSAANRIFNILDIPPTIVDAGKQEPSFDNGAVIYQDVSLRFADNKYALQDFSLNIKPGKTYAFVGSSGSGKTTVSNLIIRLFDPQNGQISINGVDIKDMPLEYLRSNIALVTQETMLFDASVSDNIAYGLDDVSRGRIEHAAKAANAHEFIMALPQGYDTILGSNGRTLSGGQRQRISIARALCKDAPILVLDEATSALDPISEHIIINNLEKIRQGRTNLIITHRLYGIKEADQIVVMKHGVIVEQGKHKELLALDGEYHHLYNKELQQKRSDV